MLALCEDWTIVIVTGYALWLLIDKMFVIKPYEYIWVLQGTERRSVVAADLYLGPAVNRVGL